MTRRILITPKASQDLDDIYNFIAQDNSDTALRFFDAARQTFNQLAKNPGIGIIYEVSKPELQGLRKWRVKRFDKYIIFYRYCDDLVEIIRILYAGRDIAVILEDESK
jgi:toxin ParE1/3/4